MTVDNKIIHEVAKELGFSVEQVRQVVKSRGRLTYDTIKVRSLRTIPFINFGTFRSSQGKVAMKDIRVQATRKRIKNRKLINQEADSPIEFEE